MTSDPLTREGPPRGRQEEMGEARLLGLREEQVARIRPLLPGNGV